MDTYKLWIGGKEEDGTAELLDVEDPATGEVFARCHAASPADVEKAIQLGHATFLAGTWSSAPRHHRADVLDRAAVLLEAALPTLIPLEVRQTGRAIREMNAQVPSLVKWFRYFASVLRTEERAVLPTTGKLHNWIERRPLGVVVQITPFNHPLLIAVKKLAPALAAGNSVVLKPSELTPLTSLLLGKILKEAGLPDGVLAVLPGLGATTGKALVEHELVRKVDVTGGTEAGRAIGRAVGGNLARYTAELGGKAPVIIFEKADLEAAVNGAAFGAFIASGQTCVAATRLIVHRSIEDQVIIRLANKARSIRRRMGAPTNPKSMMGPLISAKQLQRVEGALDKPESSDPLRYMVIAGAGRMTGVSELDGTDFLKGYFFPPTVLRGLDSVIEHKVWWEELFAPILVTVPFDTEEDAIRLANMSHFGLGAAIWTQDLSQAFRVSEKIDAGVVWVNTHHRNDPSSPWGGAKTASGVGSENGIEAYHAYTTTKSTIINYASSEEMACEDWFREDDAEVRYG